MPRPVWSGTISFGLVAIPIKLFHGVSKKSVSFNQLDDRSMSRIRLKKVSAETGEDVDPEGAGPRQPTRRGPGLGLAEFEIGRQRLVEHLRHWLT